MNEYYKFFLNNKILIVSNFLISINYLVKQLD